MGPYSADVAVRWSDMDVFQHVNNARVVTLLEEARTQMLLDEGARYGADVLLNGLVVVDLEVRYRAPLLYSPRPVQIQMWVSELRTAWFTLEYSVRGLLDSASGASGADGGSVGEAVTARTRLAPYETRAKRPRRLSAAEREFLTHCMLADDLQPAGRDGQARRDGAGGG